MTPEEAREIINPPVPYMSDKDHQIAMYRYYIESLEDHLFEMHFSILHSENIDPESWCKKTADLVNTFDWETQEFDPTELPESKKLREWLSEPHYGDCTAFASSCIRCVAEKYYNIDTAPPDKKTGNKAASVLREAQKANEDHT